MSTRSKTRGKAKLTGSIRAAGIGLVVAVLCAACDVKPAPRTFAEFMEDGIAREGALARCNQDRRATLDDLECANARRAAAVVALEQEQSRRVSLERESERKLVAMRDRAARQQQAESAAAAAAEAAAQAAYEAQYKDPKAAAELPAADAGSNAQPARSFGAPIGNKMPSMSENKLLDVYSDSSGQLPRPELQVAEAKAPESAVEIPHPQLDAAEIKPSIPRPFRAADESAQ